MSRGFSAAERERATATVILGLALLLPAVPVHAQGPRCAPDNAGVTLPDGFCALVVADSLGRARHLTVAANGDVLVAVPGRDSGGVVLLRDTDGDGVADERRYVVDAALAVDVQLVERGDEAWLYYSTYREVIRFPWDAVGGLVTGGPDTIAAGLPGARQHGIKTFVLDGDRLFVNLGAPANACQVEPRTAGSPGQDPCPLLDSTGGIWLFAANRGGQSAADGDHYATGLRNTVALAVRPADGELYGVVHGRDQLGQLWGFSDSASAEKPAEEFVRITRGLDLGWPYCYYDPETKTKVLSPEYGGDGAMVGRCAEKASPLIGFPAHWAPDGLHFYQGTQFPAAYRGGAFVAFHGSWNRAPLPQQGFNLVFVPFDGDRTGEWRVFADGFQEIGSRPVDVAEGPDGSLYVSDDAGGRVYRILHAAGR